MIPMPIPNRSGSNRISWLTSCHACLNTLSRNHHLPREQDPSPHALSYLFDIPRYLLKVYRCLWDIIFTSIKYFFVQRLNIFVTISLKLYQFLVLIITFEYKYVYFVSQQSENPKTFSSRNYFSINVCFWNIILININ